MRAAAAAAYAAVHSSSVAAATSTAAVAAATTVSIAPTLVRQPLYVIRLGRYPILKQLQLEERLLRETNLNWCLFNSGPAPPEDPTHAHGSVIIGLSGNPSKLVHLKELKEDGVALIKRYSGGGTVYLDNGCRMISLLVNSTALPHVQPYPRPIMSWTGQLYSSAFNPFIPQFHLKENDYVIGTKKVAGNAQSITRGRWCHHTSFLWDYDSGRMMRYLKQPEKVPDYRVGRSHQDFVCRMKEYWQHHDITPTTLRSSNDDPELVFKATQLALAQWFNVDATVSLDDVLTMVAKLPPPSQHIEMTQNLNVAELVASLPLTH